MLQEVCGNVQGRCTERGRGHVRRSLREQVHERSRQGADDSRGAGAGSCTGGCRQRFGTLSSPGFTGGLSRTGRELVAVGGSDAAGYVRCFP
eukprot:scaffold1557_cov108-Isochrysis_galbana.AAC.10